MIIEFLINVIIRAFRLLSNPIHIPAFPDEVIGWFQDAFSYVQAGVGILMNYAPLPYIMSLVGIVIAIDVGMGIYHLIMWVLRKVPMLSIE